MNKKFEPRRWQIRFIEEYQANPKKNILLEACTSAGKTGGTLYTFISLQSSLD